MSSTPQTFLSNGLSSDTLSIDIGILLVETEMLKERSNELLQQALSMQERDELRREALYVPRYTVQPVQDLPS